MSGKAPSVEAPVESFSLRRWPGKTLGALVEDAGLDEVHFFFRDALSEGMLGESGEEESAEEFGLVAYEHPEAALDAGTFEALSERGWQPATMRDLLRLALDRPDLQREFEVVALGTLRTRRVFKDKPGETVWDQDELDRSICQWAVGLSRTGEKRTLVPVELFLPKVLRAKTLLLVRM